MNHTKELEAVRQKKFCRWREAKRPSYKHAIAAYGATMEAIHKLPMVMPWPPHNNTARWV